MSKNKQKITALRSSALTFVNDPFLVGAKDAMRFEEDALIVIENGKIKSFGTFTNLKKTLPPKTKITHVKDALILPGLIDLHVHYPQTQMIGSYGKQLIDWLDNYIFVSEQEFSNRKHAKKIAKVFLDECLRSGTTTAAVYCTVHTQSVDAFFEEAKKRNMRMIAGKVLMDQNAPKALLDTAQLGYDQSKKLIQKWHNKARLQYAITPRFAPTSTPEQLEAAGALKKEFSDVYMQTHISENKSEVELVKKLFPKNKNYLDVYDQFGLLSKKTILGHGIHLTEPEWQRCYESGSAIAHCPTSNTFLGSGLFSFNAAKKKNRPVKVGLATDLGAGTSFSLIKTMGEAYKVSQLAGYLLSPIHAFYLATRGAAQALSLEDKIGSIAEGFEADLFILDLKSTPLIDFRMKYCQNIEEILFVQMVMADDRATHSVYIAGQKVFEKS